MDQNMNKTPQNTQRLFNRSVHRTKSSSQHEFPTVSRQPTQSSQRIELETDRETDFGSGITHTRNLTLKTAQTDIRTPDILLSQPLSARGKLPSPMRVTTDNFFSLRGDKAASRAGHNQESKTQDQYRALRMLRGVQTDFGLNSFYLTSRSDRTQFKINHVSPARLNSEDFRPTAGVLVVEGLDSNPSPKLQAPGSIIDANITPRVKLSSFYESLPPSMRDFYADKKDFSKIFEDYNVSNYCLTEVTAKVKCYRIELGLLLEKALENQRKLYEKTLDTAMKLFSHQELIIEKQLNEIRENVKQIEIEKQILEEKNNNFKNLLNISESSSRVQTLSIEKLQSEIKIAHEIHKEGLMAKLNEKSRGENLLPEQSKESKNKGATERLQDDIANLQGFFEELDREHMNKARIIKDMSNHLKATLKKIKYDATTQVDEIELAWTAKNIKSAGGDSIRKADLLTIESSTVNVEGKIKGKTSELEKNPEIEPGDVLKLKDKEMKEKMDSESPLAEGRRKQTQIRPINQGQGAGQELESNWNLPLNIIVFLENAGKSGESAKVLPWAYFKKKIIEIYKDRIRNRTEIDNSIINTFIPLNEYICLYFLREHKLRRTAEMKLLEFLVSLKYYVKIWPRAQTFASMCNILGAAKKDPQETINVNEYDIYLQNYVLYAYEHTFSEANSLVEHSEGTTWIPKQKVEDIVHSVLIFESELNRKRFWVNLQTQYRIIGEGPEKDNEGMDADKLILAFIEGYVEAKRRNLKAVSKYYYKNNQDTEKILSIEDFASALAEVNDVEPAVANQVYPKDLTLCRSFLYALTSGSNSYAVTFKNLVNGLARFGMDCPFPFISLKGDEQRNHDYYTGELASDFFKKKNQPPKKRGAIFQEKKRLPGVARTSEFNRDIEEQSQIVPRSAYDFSALSSLRRETEVKNNHGLKVDATSALFAQQFSVLRELDGYCKQFSELVETGDQEFETMLKSFKQIAQILQRGCEFLKFPVNIY